MDAKVMDAKVIVTCLVDKPLYLMGTTELSRYLSAHPDIAEEYHKILDERLADLDDYERDTYDDLD